MACQAEVLFIINIIFLINKLKSTWTRHCSELHCFCRTLKVYSDKHSHSNFNLIKVEYKFLHADIASALRNVFCTPAKIPSTCRTKRLSQRLSVEFSTFPDFIPCIWRGPSLEMYLDGKRPRWDRQAPLLPLLTRLICIKGFRRSLGHLQPVLAGARCFPSPPNGFP